MSREDEIADAMNRIAWRGRRDWIAWPGGDYVADGGPSTWVRVPPSEAAEAAAVAAKVAESAPELDPARSAALWCAFRDLALDALYIYGGVKALDRYGLRYHWRWAVHRYEWDGPGPVVGLTAAERELGWKAMNDAWAAAVAAPGETEGLILMRRYDSGDRERRS